MNFRTILESGRARKVPINKIRALNLFKSSNQAIQTAKVISLNEESSKTIFRELYEGLREYCEAIGYTKGYKFLDHEAITYFLTDVLKERIVASKFDRYRRLRNGINYYGESIDIETVKLALLEIPKLVETLNNFLG